MADQRRTPENIRQALREAQETRNPTTKIRNDRPTTHELNQGLAERLKELRNR